MQVAFDEATQDILEKVVPKHSEVAQKLLAEHPRAILRGGKVLTVGIQHSMVTHCKMCFWKGDEIIEQQEAVIPAPVADTTHRTTAVAVVTSLERWVFGMDIASWMATLGFLAFFWVFIGADHARSNVKMLRYVQLSLAAAAVCITDIWYERCGLHQLGRIRNAICDRYKSQKQMRGLFNFLRMKKNKLAFAKHLRIVMPNVVRINSHIMRKDRIENMTRAKRCMAKLFRNKSHYENGCEHRRHAAGDGEV